MTRAKRQAALPEPEPVEQRLARVERQLAALQWPPLEFALIEVLEKYRRLADPQSENDYERACIAEVDAIAGVVTAIELDEPAVREVFDAARKRWYADGRPLIRLQVQRWAFHYTAQGER